MATSTKTKKEESLWGGRGAHGEEMETMINSLHEHFLNPYLHREGDGEDDLLEFFGSYM